MEHPTFNKKKQKTTLSAKKKKAAPVKHVLASPYNKKNIPIVNTEHQKTLETLLDIKLPKIKHDKIRVPYKAIKNVPLDKRKEFRDKFYDYKGIALDSEYKNCIAIGINNVTKNLESNASRAVLISDDVKPKIMTDHIFDLASLYKVPVLIVANLRNILKKCTGISGTCISFKNNIDADSTLNILVKNIEEISTNYPLFEENDIASANNLDASCIVIEDDRDRHQKVTLTNIDHDAIRSKLYLKRTETNHRVFKPESIEEPMEIDTTKIWKTSSRKRKQKYKALKVKVLKGDSNRNKRKIEQIKLSKNKNKSKKKKMKVT